MSYTKKTWHDGDTITAAGLNNMETGIKNNDTAVAAAASAAAAASDAAADAAPLHVPFTMAVDGEGHMSVTTTADYATVRAAAIAKRTVIADVAVPGGMLVMSPLWGYNDTDLFFSVQIMPDSGASAAEFYSMYWSATQVLFIAKTVALA